MIKKTLLLALLLVTVITSDAYAQRVKFGIITDIHHDIIPDAPKRLDVFLKAARKANVDFVIDLGDFAMIKQENDAFVEQWKNSGIEHYNVLGNHDMDNCSKEEFMEYVGMKSRYYSFEKRGVLFIVLDANNMKKGEEYIHYKNANFYTNEATHAWIDPEQVEWLDNELKRDFKTIIIFSHQPLDAQVYNGKEIQKMLETENKRAGYTKIPVAFSGHLHMDYETVINGISYIQINSASDQWIGTEWSDELHYEQAAYDRSPNLKVVAPYRDALYGIVTMNSRRITLRGVYGEFVSPTPQEKGLTDSTLKATVSNRRIKLEIPPR